MRWLFFLTPAADGARNMALDEALMRHTARSGEAVFRVYGWSTPTLSLGRNQRARGCYDQSAAREMGIEFVRRPTGGRALLHHREVTYSATLPVMHSEGASAAYDFINGVLLHALTRLGVPAVLATSTTSIPPGLRPCFDVPADREITVGGRKLVGSAQWRSGAALLQHGSILVHDDQPLIARLLRGAPGTTPSAATLSHTLGRAPSMEQVGGHIREALQCATSADVDPFAPSAEVEADAAELRETYVTDAWTWRR